MEHELDYEAIGTRIRRHRKDRNLTQEVLAEQCGISTAFIGHIERGTRKLSVETLFRIAQKLNVSADYLLFESQTSNNDLLSQIASILNGKDNEKSHALLSAVKILSERLEEIE